MTIDSWIEKQKEMKLPKDDWKPSLYTMDQYHTDTVSRPDSLSTGWENLDERIRYPNSALTFVTAPTSHGKSAWLQNSMYNLVAGTEMEHGALFVAIEELPVAVMRRILQIASNEILRLGNNSEGFVAYEKGERQDNEIIENARTMLQAYIAGKRLRIMDGSNVVISALCDRTRQHHAWSPLSAIFIDYLQEIPPDDNTQIRHLQIGDSCDQLKALARELKCAVVVAVQIGRAGASKNELAELFHMRESGAVENKGDTVIILHNKDQGDSSDGRAELDVKLAKARNAPRGKIPNKVYLDGDTMRITVEV